MMTALFLYSIKCAFVLVLLYVPYALLLHREKCLGRNRLTLLAILGLSLTLPLCNVSSWSMDNLPVMHQAQRQCIEAGIPIHTANDEWTAATVDIDATPLAPQESAATTISPIGTATTTVAMPANASAPTPQAPAEQPQHDWFQTVSLLFAIGMALVLVVRLLQFGRMGLIIRRGSLWQEHTDGINIYCHSGQIAPFCWLNNIVISSQDYDNNGREIILHEEGHIRHRHSLDIVLLTLVQMLQWWNPLVYLLARHLRDVHEFEADDYVLRQGIDAHSYQLLLLQTATGNTPFPIVNRFNHSIIKNRIKMMCRREAKSWTRSKALYVIPLSMLALSVFATPSIIQPIESSVNALAEEVTQTPPAIENDTTIHKKYRSVSYAQWLCPGGWMRRISIAMPRGTWVEDHITNKSYIDELGMDPVWFKPDSPFVYHNHFDTTIVIKIDGVVYDKHNLPSQHWSKVKKVEYYPNPNTVNIVTKDVVVPSTIKDNVPREQTIVLRNRKCMYVLDGKAKKGDWTYHQALSWTRTGDNIYFYFHYTQRKPDLKVYIYASTEVTQKEIDRAVGVLNELGIKNYEIVKDIPIYHWTDEQYRAWAEKQKALGVKYSVSALQKKLTEEYVDLNDMIDMRRWNRVIRPVFKPEKPK